MSLFSLIGGAIEAVGFDDFVGDLIKPMTTSLGPLANTFSDVFSGAATNAAVAAIAGGDIGKAALFGAAGGALKSGGFGFADELGAGLTGYGLDKALGGNGLTGALASAAGSYLNNSYKNSKSATTGASGASSQAMDERTLEMLNDDIAAAGGDKASIAGSLEKFGLLNKDGLPTLVGEGLLAAAGGAGQYMSTKSLLEKQHENALERDREQQKLETQGVRDRISFFTDEQNKYRVTRS